MFGLILYVYELIVSPFIHWFLDINLHVFGDLVFETRRLEERSYEAMDFPMQAPIEYENGGFSHQLGEGFRVKRLKSLGVTLQDKFGHFCICWNNSWSSKYVWLEHFPVPAKQPKFDHNFGEWKKQP